jgi:hypothetical protein
MSGTLLIHTPDMRLCELDAHLEHRVEFGYGILGQLSDKTHFFLAREEVSPAQWATTTIRVHLDGSIQLLKSISREVDASRYGFKPVAHGLTGTEAAAILRSNTFLEEFLSGHRRRLFSTLDPVDDPHTWSFHSDGVSSNPES